MTKINKEFFENQHELLDATNVKKHEEHNGISDERMEEIIKECNETQIEDNAITDKIDREETQKENETILIERKSVEYHKLKVSDLPLYKKYEGMSHTVYYKLEVIDGKQKCIKIVIDEKLGCRVDDCKVDSLFDIENTDSNEMDWILATAKVLNYISPTVILGTQNIKK